MSIISVGSGGQMIVKNGFALSVASDVATGCATPPPGTPFAWWDASDLTQLFQDTAGTTPTAVDGDPIRRINNKGVGETIPLISTNPASGDVWVANWNGLGCGAVNGGPAADELTATSTATTTGSWTRAVIYSSNVPSNTHQIGEWTTNGTRTEQGSISNDVQARFGTGGAFFDHADANVVASALVGHIMTWNGADDTFFSRVSSSATLVTGTKVFQNMASGQKLTLIRSGTASQRRVGEWLVWDGLIDPDSIVTYFANKWGVVFVPAI
jgi:hypothetical protein